MKQVRITVDGRGYEVTLETTPSGERQVTIDGHTYRIGAVDAVPGTRMLHVALDDVPHSVARTDLQTVTIDGVSSMFHIDQVTSGAAAGLVGKEGAEIRPPMPGKVVALHVAEGETVAAGQVLLVLEAMKMQNEVLSPATGVVTRIQVKAGATVDTKDLLILLGPPTETDPARQAEMVA